MADNYDGSIKLQLEIESDKASKRFDKLQDSIKTKTANVTKETKAQTNKAIEDILKTAQEVTPAMEKLQKQIIKQTDSFAKLSDQKDALISGVEGYREKYDKITESIVKQRLQVEKLKKQVELTYSDLDAGEGEYFPKSLKNLQTQFDTLQKARKDLIAKINSAQAEIAEIQSSPYKSPFTLDKLKNLQAELKSLETQKSDVDKQLDITGDKLGELELNPKLIPEVAELENKLAFAEYTLNKLNKQREQGIVGLELKSTDKASDLAKSYDATSQSIQNAQKELSEMIAKRNAEIEAEKEAERQHNLAVEQYNQQLSATATNLNQIETELNAIHEGNAELLNDGEGYNQSLAKAQETLESLYQKGNELEIDDTNLRAVQDRLNEVRASLYDIQGKPITFNDENLNTIHDRIVEFQDFVNTIKKQGLGETLSDEEIQQTADAINALGVELDEVAETAKTVDLNISNEDLDDAYTEFNQMVDSFNDIKESIEQANESMVEFTENAERAANSTQSAAKSMSTVWKENSTSTESAADSTEKLEKRSNRLHSVYVRLTSGIKKLAKGFADVGKRILHLNKNANPLDKLFGRLSRRLMQMLKQALIFSVLMKGLNALKKAFSNLLQTDPQIMQSFVKIKANLLTAFAPLYEYVLPIIRTIFQTLVSATQYLAQIMSSLFGKSIKQSQKAAKGLSKATKNAKELNKQLGHLDELNTDISTESGSDAGEDELKFDNFEISAKVQLVTDKIKKWIGDLKDLIKKGDWEGVGNYVADGLNTVITKVREKIQSLNLGDIALKITNTLNGFIKKFDWYNMGGLLADGLNQALDFLYNAVTNFDWKGLGHGVANYLNGLKDNIDWEKLGDTFSNIMTGCLDFCNTALKDFDWLGLGDSIGVWLETIKWKEIAEKAIDLLVNGFKALFNFAIGLMPHLIPVGRDLMAGLFEGLMRALDDVSTFLADNVISPLVDNLCDCFGIDKENEDNLFLTIGKHLIQALFDGIVSMMNGVSDWLADNVIDPIAKGLESGWNKITGIFKKKDVEINVSEGGHQYTGGGGRRIPGLATGTVVPASSRKFLAVLGDNKKETEVVSPLSTMKDAMLQALQDWNGSETEQNITLQIDGDEFFNWIVKKNKQNYLQTHQNMLVY